MLGPCFRLPRADDILQSHLHIEDDASFHLTITTALHLIGDVIFQQSHLSHYIGTAGVQQNVDHQRQHIIHVLYAAAAAVVGDHAFPDQRIPANGAGQLLLYRLALF